MYLTWTDCTQYIHCKNSNGCRLILICTSYIGSIQLSWDSWLNMLLPVTLALKILQGESSVHMGFLLPTLYQLQDELNKQESSRKVYKPLIDALQHGIQKRLERQ